MEISNQLSSICFPVFPCSALKDLESPSGRIKSSISNLVCSLNDTLKKFDLPSDINADKTITEKDLLTLYKLLKTALCQFCNDSGLFCSWKTSYIPGKGNWSLHSCQYAAYAASWERYKAEGRDCSCPTECVSILTWKVYDLHQMYETPNGLEKPLEELTGSQSIALSLMMCFFSIHIIGKKSLTAELMVWSNSRLERWSEAFEAYYSSDDMNEEHSTESEDFPEPQG